MRGGRVKDPVHGYVAFTAVERAIFDHPVAQRLRTVSQSAAAHLVFPEMRVSRFAHSLGAMHLASRFLAASLRNAAEPEQERISAGCRALVGRHSHLGLGTAETDILREPSLVAGRELPHVDVPAVLFVEQGLRLASLAHDLGHLPFSHDFESALDDRMKVDEALQQRLAPLFAEDVRGGAAHERIGYALAAQVQGSVFDSQLAGTSEAKLAEVSLLIARDILDAPAAPELDDDPTASVLAWLHTLVDGQIDVDRADYVLRDVRAYDIAAAGYDLDRLVDGLTAVAVGASSLVTAIQPSAVSAAESFFVARFRMYAWAIFHHKVQQAAMGLRVAIEDVLEHGGPEIDAFCDAIVAIATGTADATVLARFAGYDDVWFTGLMRDRLLAGPPQNVEPWSALFLQRRPGPITLWKRASDFPVEDRAAWNARLPSDDDADLRDAWTALASELRQEGVLLQRLPFSVWKADATGESRLQVLVDGQLKPLTRLSPLVHALQTAWADELQVHVHAPRAGLVTAPEILERLETALQPQETEQ